MKNKFFITLLFSFILFQYNTFSKNIFINGFVLNNKIPIPNVSISFINKSDEFFKTKSNEKGEYSICVPENIYLLNIEKDFFRISENNLKNYILKKDSKIDIELKETSSFLDGFVVDKNEKPIKNAKLIIKNGEYSSIIFSDDSGKFSAYIKSGIFTILISKYGYNDFALIKEIKNKSNINDVKIKLKTSDFFLRGTVTNGVQALPNIEISLHNEFFKKIDSTISDKNGLFYFNSIPLEEKFFILINNKNYKLYKSNFFKFNEKNKNKIIFLEKK